MESILNKSPVRPEVQKSAQLNRTYRRGHIKRWERTVVSRKVERLVANTQRIGDHVVGITVVKHNNARLGVLDQERQHQ